MNPRLEITGKGVVTIELLDASPHEVMRLKRILQAIVINDVLNVRSNFMRLDFDKDGELTSIETPKKWRLNDPIRPPITGL